MKTYRTLVMDSKGNLVERPKKVVPIITGTTGTRKCDTGGMTKKFQKKNTKL